MFAFRSYGLVALPATALMVALGVAGGTESVAAGTAPRAASGAEASAPDGLIPLATLREATLTIPAWPVEDAEFCASGPVKFSKGKADLVRLVGAVLHTDIDHDGAKETVVQVSCNPQWEDRQVLVFDRNASGKIITLGRLAHTGAGVEGRDIMKIWSIKPGEAGDVQVDVGDYRPCCTQAQDSPQHQWRTFGMREGKFRQTDGPTAFGPNPKVTDLAVTAGRPQVTPKPGGGWTTTVTVDIHNRGRFAVGHTGLLVMGTGTLVGANGWEQCENKPTGDPDEATARCVFPAVAPGASMRHTLGFTSAGKPTGTLSLWVESVNTNGHQYPDSDVEDNNIEAPLAA
ncbi:hypothetical protein [Pilimelia columellifera]|uniref:Uncharacterized protein n=1 Tax=Pilimelia columellifera subsp. columellifera TaxID=706583 RepID=A0ABN3N9V7_9ACTN